MIDLWIWLAYLVIGLLAGISAGLFGVGGGIIVVPALAFLFQLINFNPQALMQTAVGTSLAVIVVTSISSMREHNSQGAILWPVFQKLSPAIIVGTLLGALVAANIASVYLKILFGLVEIVIAIQLFMDFKPKRSRQLPSLAGLRAVGASIGFVSTMVGIGGGTMTGPYLNWCNVKIHNAVATSAACGVPIAVVGSIAYFFFGLQYQNSGFIFWPAFITISLVSVFAAPLGARMAHRLSTLKLKRYFALFLLLVGGAMLLT